MAPHHRIRGASHGRGRQGSEFNSPSPSPSGRNTSRAPIYPSGSSTPSTKTAIEVDDDSTSTKRRRWTSSVWKHYNIKEGKHFSDGNDRAYCKYYNGGLIDANSSNEHRKQIQPPSQKIEGSRKDRFTPYLLSGHYIREVQMAALPQRRALSANGYSSRTECDGV
ncbi:hypothetical protein Cgig2_005805 [Carnegiea gigantea]|uniref:Uncharacterized protein n=1 Tax=Carnegiea gigantea TaxID=171969 RepID=A0A9Q1KIG5_9CARY|nr:hypothetical protein Cgig2_005805 [Carnegiea gigantea]